MKRKNMLLSILLTALLTVGLLTGFVSPAPVEEAREQLSQLSDFIPANVPGFTGAVLVAQGENILFADAFGMADPERGIETTVDTTFLIASISKSVTGAAILILESEGKISRSDTLDMFFTGHDDLAYVTIDHLLSMRGGFDLFSPRDVLGNINFTDLDNLADFSYGFLIYTIASELAGETETIMDAVLSLTPEVIEAHIIANWDGRTPRSFASSNADTYLLARIVSRASEMPFEDFVMSRIFESAGMTRSGFGGAHVEAVPSNEPFIVDGVDLNNAMNWPFSIAYGTGGFSSTVGDLNLFLDAYFGGRLFPEHMLDTIYNTTYNFGWSFITNRIFRKGGYVGGLSSFVMYERSSSTRIIFITTTPYDVRVGRIVPEITRILWGM